MSNKRNYLILFVQINSTFQDKNYDLKHRYEIKSFMRGRDFFFQEGEV